MSDGVLPFGIMLQFLNLAHEIIEDRGEIVRDGDGVRFAFFIVDDTTTHSPIRGRIATKRGSARWEALHPHRVAIAKLTAVRICTLSPKCSVKAAITIARNARHFSVDSDLFMKRPDRLLQRETM
jgi:hypothetical protein